PIPSSPHPSPFSAHPSIPSFPTRRSSDLSLFRGVVSGIVAKYVESKLLFFYSYQNCCHNFSPLEHRIQTTTVFSLEKPLVLDLRSEEHTSELQSRFDLVCRLLLEKKRYMA